MPRKFIRSARFALAGLRYLFATQRNARIQLTVACVAVVLSAWLRISRAEWSVLVLAIAAVLILEGLNTAIEAVVDLASPEQHKLAKVAKDVSAGTVLIAAIASAVIGAIIFLPRLIALF